MRFCRFLPFAALFAAAPVSAGLFDSLQSGLGYVFDLGATNINFLRLLMALLIFAVMYRPMLNALKDNRAAALVVSLIVAVIGVRFMPAELLLRMAAFIWILLLFAVPYLLLGKLFTNTTSRIVAAVVAAGVLVYLLQDYLGFGLQFSLLVDLYYLFADSPSLLLFVIAIIMVLVFAGKFLFKKRS